MKAYEYILSKQMQWALNNNIKLIDSKGVRGRLAYTKKLEDNLFWSCEFENLDKAIEIMKECGADGWVEKYEKELAVL